MGVRPWRKVRTRSVRSNSSTALQASRTRPRWHAFQFKKHLGGERRIFVIPVSVTGGGGNPNSGTGSRFPANNPMENMDSGDLPPPFGVRQSHLKRAFHRCSRSLLESCSREVSFFWVTMRSFVLFYFLCNSYLLENYALVNFRLCSLCGKKMVFSALHLLVKMSELFGYDYHDPLICRSLTRLFRHLIRCKGRCFTRAFWRWGFHLAWYKFFFCVTISMGACICFGINGPHSYVLFFFGINGQYVTCLHAHIEVCFRLVIIFFLHY